LHKRNDKAIIVFLIATILLLGNEGNY
jgi:hypothetical protein